MAGPLNTPPLKGLFPFRLCTTSFILPAPILPNLRFLSTYVDEVELVLFESRHNSNLPSKREIREMIQVASGNGLTYNVHLPTDIFLGDPDPKVRQKAVETVLRFYERTLPLSPTGYVLHLERNSSQDAFPGDITGWAHRTESSLEGLAERGVDTSFVALENLDYPPGVLEPFVHKMGFNYCIDLGHLIRYGFEVIQELKSFLPRSLLVHVHGVKGGLDHRGLDAINDSLWQDIKEVLWGFGGSVSIEVFSWEDLAISLERLRAWIHVQEMKDPGRRP